MIPGASLKLQDRRQGDVLEYRAYMIGRDGHIKHRVDILCSDDDAAIARALLLVDGNSVELWHGTRMIATLPTKH